MSKNPLKHSLTMHVGQFDILSLSSFEIPAHCINNLCGRHLFPGLYEFPYNGMLGNVRLISFLVDNGRS